MDPLAMEAQPVAYTAPVQENPAPVQENPAPVQEELPVAAPAIAQQETEPVVVQEEEPPAPGPVVEAKDAEKATKEAEEVAREAQEEAVKEAKEWAQAQKEAQEFAKRRHNGRWGDQGPSSDYVRLLGLLRHPLQLVAMRLTHTASLFAMPDSTVSIIFLGGSSG